MFSILKHRKFPRSLSDETGATTAVFSIVVLIGIMAGTFALVVDAGQLFLERRVVQNVADASAQYLAQSCATGQNCQATIPSSYTENNSPDSRSKITEICGTPNGFNSCIDIAGDIRDCLTPSATLANSNFVRVRTETLTISNKSALSPTFARLFGANSDDEAWTLRGCSQAIWDAPSSLKVKTPLSMSICEFVPPTSSTTGSPQFAPAWALSASGPCSISDLDGRVINGTHIGVAPVAIPGMDAKCIEGTNLSIGQKIIYANGADAPRQLCEGIGVKLLALVNSEEPVYIPIFGFSETVNGNLELTVISFVRFKLTAYSVNPPLGCKQNFDCKQNWDNNPAITSAEKAGCNGKDLCVVGEFLKGVPSSGNVSEGSDVPSLGPLAVKLIP